jgi:hypothetical protein
MNNSLVDYYRCPERYARFAVKTPYPDESGYFRFGESAICYGKCNGARPTAAPVETLHDASFDTGVKDGNLFLPFDLNEVSDNLRYELYANPGLGGDSGLQSAVNRAYYFVRPVLPISVRKHLQKIHLNGWNEMPFPHWPVDRSVDKLHQQILLLSLNAQKVARIPFIWFWPNGTTSAAIITHDVETARGKDFCTTLMDIDDSFGMKASFQVVPERRYKVTPQFLDSITSRGFEIGVQDLNHDGHLYRNKREFMSRAAKINSYGRQWGAEGFRAAVLYRRQEWFDALDFSYDMSVPNVAHLDPQRGGCCTVMPYFLGKLLELPVTTTQDYSLLHILKHYSIDLWKRQIELIMESHGLLSFIVHPDYISGHREQETYKDLLRHLVRLRNENKIWISTPKEVDKWWRQRANLTLVEKDGGWQIEGVGKERASLAYASEKEGCLELTIEPSIAESATAKR